MSIEIETLQAQQAQLTNENSQLKMEVENLQMQLRGPSAPVLDCVAYITIKYYANGGLQVSGHIGDEETALSLLEHAKDAVRAQHARGPAPAILAPNGQPMLSIPNRDVDVKMPERFDKNPAFGDMKPGERGDLPPS
jgi:hypothetical protein